MDAHNFLVYLMAKHNECHARLEESLLISQKMVMETLDTVRNKHQTVLLELAMLRENYNVDYLMSMVNQEGVNDEQKLVYQHAVCSTILAQNKFEGHLWEKQTSEIRTVAAEMAIVLENICGLLSG